MTNRNYSKFVFSIVAIALPIYSTTFGASAETRTSFVLGDSQALSQQMGEERKFEADGSRFYLGRISTTAELACAERQNQEIEAARNSAAYRDMKQRLGPTSLGLSVRHQDVYNPSPTEKRELLGKNLRLNPGVFLEPFNPEKFEESVYWKLKANPALSVGDLRNELSRDIEISPLIAKAVKSETKLDIHLHSYPSQFVPPIGFTKDTYEPLFSVCHVVPRDEIAEAVRSKMALLDRTFARAVDKARVKIKAETHRTDVQLASEAIYSKIPVRPSSAAGAASGAGTRQ